VKEKNILMQLEDAWAKDAVSDLDGQTSFFAMFILVILCSFLALFGGLLMWCLSAMPQSKVAATMAALTERQKSLYSEVKSVMERKDFFLLLEVVIVQGTEYDRERLDEFMKKIAAVAFPDTGDAKDQRVDKAFIRPPSQLHKQELKRAEAKGNGGQVVSA